MTTQPNPLLEDGTEIPFGRIRATHVEPAVRRALDDARDEVDALAKSSAPPTWDNTVQRLEEALQRLSDRLAPASHLMTVSETPELRSAYNRVLADISAFWSSIPLDAALGAGMSAYAATDEARALTGLRRRHLDKTVREFERAGANLEEHAKERLRALRVERAALRAVRRKEGLVR